MTLKNVGRTKLNIKVYQEYIEKERNDYFFWEKTWSPLLTEYQKLQKELTSNLKPQKTDHLEIKETRSLKPFPKTTNGMYGWVSTKKEFRLEYWGSLPLL